MTVARPCLVEECLAPPDPGCPLELCSWHLGVAAEWVMRADGVTDVLPTPCVLCGSRVGVRWPSGWVCAICEWRHGEPVDDELPPPRIDVVYYVRYGDRIKIGTTARPRQRLAAVWHDEVLAFERGDRRLERRRHDQFAAQRLGRSEWFQMGGDLLTHVEVVSGGAIDPWDLVARWTSEAIALRG